MKISFPSAKLLQDRRTKIIATVGPASRETSVIESLIQAGASVFRLNMSHGDHAAHQVVYERIRAAAEKFNQPIAVMVDLSGPKIRVGHLLHGQVGLTAGSHVVVTTRDVVGGPGLIPSQYAALAADVQPGNRILLDDGLIELRVETVSGTDITCKVINGGVLKDHKGINLPGVRVSAPALTEKDCADARFALELGADFLALSFVRKPDDVLALKALINEAGQSTHVIAKIEKPEALASIEQIVDVADGIMVARGDLGVELSPEEVPLAQHQLVALARAKNTPVIVATQMLESMIQNPRPTRAEVSDVSHAVFGGADAIMLSAETAIGEYPVAAVQMMDRVARQVEAWQATDGGFRSLTEQREAVAPPLPLHVAVARATSQLSRDLIVRTIVVLSRTGTTATMMAVARPAAPILAATTSPAVWRRMNLLWGVIPLLVDVEEFKHAQKLARRFSVDLKMAEPGNFLLLVAGMRSDELESTPMVTVLRV